MLARCAGPEWPSPASGRPSNLVAAWGTAIGLGWLRAARHSCLAHGAEACGMPGGCALTARDPCRLSWI